MQSALERRAGAVKKCVCELLSGIEVHCELGTSVVLPVSGWLRASLVHSVASPPGWAIQFLSPLSPVLYS